MISWIKQRWHLYAAGIVLMLVATWLDMVLPIITGRIIDEVITGGNQEIFPMLLISMLAITAGRAVLGYGKEMSFNVAAADIVKRLRKALFDHIQSLSQSFFEKKSVGELMARVKDDVDYIWQGISFGIMLVIEMSLYFVVSFVFMLSISWKLTVVAAVAIPLVGWLAYRLESEVDEVYGRISEQNASLNTTAQENIAGIRLVKAFAREKHELLKFFKKNKGYYELNMEYARAIARRFPDVQMITRVLPVFVVIAGGWLVVEDGMTIGTLAKFLGYTMLAMWPMRIIGWIISLMAEAKGAVKKIDKIFSEEPDIKDSAVAEALPMDEVRGAVEFRNVSLELGSVEILNDISFRIEAGGSLGIMGTTGSGKTSIVNLLERFHDPKEGAVLLDGHDIRRVKIRDLRNAIAVVMQDVFLFSDSIHNNIHFGSEKELSEDMIALSAKRAQVHQFVETMEDKYETVIGERGIGLSGGQKQRISIARALSKGAKVLVFDDATSSLDTETEFAVQSEIKKLAGISQIIIGHRISSVRHADEILILEGGTVVERGSHEELLALKGRYYETYCEQYESCGVD